MLALAGILVPVTIALSWLAFLVLDAGRFSQSVTPIIDTPEVQSAVASTLTSAIEQSLKDSNEQNMTVQSLVLTAGGISAIMAVVEPITERAVATSQFRALWHDANYVAHSGITAMLANDPDDHNANGEELTVAFDQINSTLGIDPESPTGRVLAAIPDALAPRIAVLHSIDVPIARFVLDNATRLAVGAIVLTILLFGGGFWFSPNRRRAFMVVGIVGLISLPIAIIVRSVLTDKLGDMPDTAGILARAYAGALTSSLESSLLMAAAIAAIVAVLAWWWPRLARQEPAPLPA